MKHLPVIEAPVDACWRRIGVAGDRSCAELQRHVHCRNCAVYAGAAQRSLQRPVDADYRDTWAQELSRIETPAAPTDGAAMVLRVGAEWLAVPVAMVVSVAPLAGVHRLPHRSGGALLGIVNVDGRLLPAVSPALLLGIAPAPASEGAAPGGARHSFARLLVLAAGDRQFALPVDEVRGLVRYAHAALRPPAATLQQAPGTLVGALLAADGIEAGLLDAGRFGASLEEVLR